MPRDTDFIADGDFDDERPDVGGFVPIGKKKDVRFRRRDGVEGTKEKVVAKFRACLVCKIIASEDQFFHEGCPNCQFLNMKGSRQSTWDCTTPNFSGMMALIKPEASWAAKFNRIERGIPGCYAVDVFGELPERVKDLAA